MIIAVVAVAWLAFGVPQFLSVPRPVDEEVRDPAEQIGGAVRILRSRDGAAGSGSGPGGVSAQAGSPADAVGRGVRPASVPLVGADGEQFARAEISTRFTRRAELSRLRQIEVAAVRIRRRALFGVALVDLLVVLGCLFLGWPWGWYLGAGALAVVGFVALRVSVVLVDRELDRRITALRDGNQERTLAISREELRAAGATGQPGSDASRTSREVVSVRQPLFDDLPRRDVAPSLWEPLPVTAPTYVQRPITPRSVRTIDLSSPDLNAAMDRAQGELPVTADGQGGAREDTGLREGGARPQRGADRASRRPKLRAVGE